MGDDGVWALIHSLTAGQGGVIELSPGENNLATLGSMFHVIGRALELAAGCHALPGTYRELAEKIHAEARSPEVKAALEGRLLVCASQGCGNVWEIKERLEGADPKRWVPCPICKRGTTHGEAAARAEEVYGVDGPATKVSQTSSKTDAGAWF